MQTDPIARAAMMSGKIEQGRVDLDSGDYAEVAIPVGPEAVLLFQAALADSLATVEIAAASVPVLDRLTCPVRFVLATGDSLGSQDGEMEQGRATLDLVLARNPNLKVSAKVASNHSKILRNDSPAVAQTVRELASSLGHAVG